MPEDRKQRCGECRFWAELEGSGDGQCRLVPPRIIEAFIVLHDDSRSVERAAIAAATHFPVTFMDDGCGMFQPDGADPDDPGGSEVIPLFPTQAAA